MDFKTFYRQLTPAEREAFAANVGTTPGYCHQIACGTKRLELGLADAIVAQSSGRVTLLELDLTERAKLQHQARGGAANEPWDGVTERRAANQTGA